MTDFTPGPWVVRKSDIWEKFFENHARRGRIAQTTVAWRSSEEAEANARLIAAAPEMYKALEFVADHLTISEGTEIISEAHDDMILRARAALGKEL